MKKIIVVFVLVAGLAAVAFASFNGRSEKAKNEIKKDKKECKHHCPYSSGI